MTLTNHQVKFWDGDDEIIFSNSVNIFNNSFKIENIEGINITFLFEDDGAGGKEKDIDISGDGNDAVITFSSKIRNTLGSGTTGKIELASVKRVDGNYKLLFSVYASKIGDKSTGMNLNVTFYKRKV